MCDELCNPVVDCVVEGLEQFGAKVSMANNYELAKLNGGSLSQIVANPGEMLGFFLGWLVKWLPWRNIL